MTAHLLLVMDLAMGCTLAFIVLVAAYLAAPLLIKDLLKRFSRKESPNGARSYT